jgi:uncharacterized protein YdaU (DUF1376 family)
MKAYFSHDEGARNDPKLVKVLMRLGQAGKGVYWDLVEMLYEQGGYLPLAEVESYAFALRTEPELIQKLLNDFGLFVCDAEHFWSETALERLKMRNEKAERRAAAGAKGGKARAEREAIAKAALEQPLSDTQALLEESEAMLEQPLSNKSKVNEIKEKETTPLPTVEDAASAAEPEPEKKIEAEPLSESCNAQAPQTEGGAADAGTRKPAKPARPLLTGDLADLLNAGGIAQRVQAMKQPLTQLEADALVAKYGTQASREIIKEMANYAKLTNNLSASLTAQKWLDKRVKAPIQAPGAPQQQRIVSQVEHRTTVIEQARAMLQNMPT